MADSEYTINSEQLCEAIIKQNSMSPCDGVVMTREGEVKPGYADDANTLCMLIPAAQLARELTASGLSSYTMKELSAWARAYDTAPLQAVVDAAVQQMQQ